MTDSGPTFDVEGLTLAWVKAVSGLVDRAGPLVGVHLTDDARSPQTGALCALSARGLREVDMEGLGDSARISFDVRAIGGEGGAKRQAERGARALASAIRNLTGSPVLVTADGVTAKLSHAHTVNGPTWVGVPGGQSTYRVDATFVWQKA